MFMSIWKGKKKKPSALLACSGSDESPAAKRCRPCIKPRDAALLELEKMRQTYTRKLARTSDQSAMERRLRVAYQEILISIDYTIKRIEAM